MPQRYFAHRELHGESGHAAGRALLAELYARHVGMPLPEIAVTSLGKPYFVDSPWHFSISHTKNHAFCVLCDRPVGLDGEELTRRVNPIVAEKALSAGERAQYEAAQDRNRALLTFWVLKEADGKRTGKGVGIHPTHTNFMLTDNRVMEHSGCLVAIICEE